MDAGTSVGGDGGDEVVSMFNDGGVMDLPIKTPTPTRAIPNAPEFSHDFGDRPASSFVPLYTLLSAPLVEVLKSGLVSFII